MKIKYPYLKDELALLEIRKHKWLESEKQGREIGFASAAIDWIKRYGEAFQQFRLATNNAQDPLTEKRQYRRFQQRLPILLSANGHIFRSNTDDINLLGFSCSLPERMSLDTVVNVSIRFRQKRRLLSGPLFTFQSRIAQTSGQSRHPLKASYRIFVPFSEDVRDYLRRQAKQFA